MGLRQAKYDSCLQREATRSTNSEREFVPLVNNGRVLNKIPHR